MGVEVSKATGDDLASWNGYVEQSAQTNCFHLREALEKQAEHVGCDLHPLIGFKGQEPVGLFPIFEIKKGPISTAFSPPPDINIPYLGPALLNVDKLKQRKAERRNESFISECLSWVDTNLNAQYTHVRVNGLYPDLRPLKWEGFDATPRYTYHVDLEPDREDLLDSFSRDARTNIRDNVESSSVRIEEGGQPAIRRIIEQVRRRYENQGITFHLSLSLVTELYEQLPDGVIRPYTCHVDDEFCGGILAYEYNDTIHRWQGGVKTGAEVDVPINDLLDWSVMVDAKDRGVSTYDLVGAENQRISKYKAKFNPTLQEYYQLERGSPAMNVAAHLYKQVRSTTSLPFK